MSSPLFQILERNLSVPDVDKAVITTTFKRCYRKTSKQVIDAWLVANELVQSGMNRTQAAKAVGARFGIGWGNLSCNWKRIESAAKAQINQGEDHGE